LARTFPFRFLNRLDDAVVIEATKKIKCSHLVTSCRWRRRRH
jgi:hypothetical protein